MTRVKICGITETSQALEAALAGADLLGLVFCESRRRVTVEKAVEISRQIRRAQPSPEIVGIFVNTPVERVNIVAETCALDRVQLSGDESWEYCLSVKMPIIKVLHISQGTDVEALLREVEKGYYLLPRKNLLFLLDSQVIGSYGGTGTAFDWRLANGLTSRFPVIMAGGLTPRNVAELVARVHPWGVDVSSGVETSGVKDIQKIKDFIKNTKG